jgi:hypothetical protein
MVLAPIGVRLLANARAAWDRALQLGFGSVGFAGATAQST